MKEDRQFSVGLVSELAGLANASEVNFHNRRATKEMEKMDFID
jgi:hypothetical protein